MLHNMVYIERFLHMMTGTVAQEKVLRMSSVYW